MRLTLPLSLLGLALSLTFTLAGSAHARLGMRPDQPARVASMRSIVDHYRTLTWTYERAAHRRTPISLRDRRSTDPRYLQWSIDAWTRRAYLAPRRALADPPRLLVRLPQAPALHARLYARVTYSQRLALSLRRIYPGHVTHPSRAPRRRRAGDPAPVAAPQRFRRPSSSRGTGRPFPPGCTTRSCASIASRAPGTRTRATATTAACSWTGRSRACTAREFVARFGTADNWPVWAQLQAAVRAYQSGRGFTPWPNTARVCGLI